MAKIFNIRWIILVIVIFTILNALAFIALGIYTSIEGYLGIIQGGVHTDLHPGLLILEALDIFLVALVFLIFAMGISVLFLPENSEKIRANLPEWVNVKSFSDLKLLLWEAVLTTLIIYFVSDIVKKDGVYNWEMLILPGSILMLSLCVFILRKH
jgi:uncharacterized membrane protein YqhA